MVLRPILKKSAFNFSKYLSISLAVLSTCVSNAAVFSQPVSDVGGGCSAYTSCEEEVTSPSEVITQSHLQSIWDTRRGVLCTVTQVSQMHFFLSPHVLSAAY